VIAEGEDHMEFAEVEEEEQAKLKKSLPSY
jgi:hypothetical protein